VRRADGAVARQRISELAAFVARLEGSPCVVAAHVAIAGVMDDEAWAATQAEEEAQGGIARPRRWSLLNRANCAAAGMAALAVVLGIGGALIGPGRAPGPAALPVAAPALVAAPAPAPASATPAPPPYTAATPAPPPYTAATPAPPPPEVVMPVPPPEPASASILQPAIEPLLAPALVAHHPPSHRPRRPAHPVRHVRRADGAAAAR